MAENREVFLFLIAGPLAPWTALAIGLVVGSFANVCIHRLPRGESVVAPRSRCPRCQTLIAAKDNVPLLSWLILRGRCRTCSSPISSRYPAVELANGLLYVALVTTLGATPRTLLAMAFCTALLILVLIDLEHHLLPDAITLPGVLCGLAGSFLPRPPEGPTPLEAVAAAAGGYVGFLLVAQAYRRLRGIEGLGQGDWKMAAMLGAFLGWQKLMLTVFLAAAAGTLVGLGLIVFRGKTAKHALPLGTFLGLAGLAVLFLGDPAVLWYWRLFHG